ncbi:MAG TPA: tetratricopeptide repeat protein, partial [Ktedonobacteraceae bacterium]|nr:tetratricopeptide repeat protein [Ktedonobacteraceae bacterium]
NNDKERALAEYRRGLSASSGNLEIEKRMQELYLSTNQIEQAAKLDSELMRQAPEDVPVNVLHGRLLLAQGKNQDAIIALQNAVKNTPDSAVAHYQLALAYWQNENLGQANTELHEALKASPPGMPVVLQSLVQLNLLQNHPSEAQVYAQELVQKNPADVSARLLLGSIYLREGMLPQAEEQFQVANRLAPNQASIHVNIGMLNAKEKKWNQAEQEFETAIRLAPSDLAMVSAYADFLVSRQQTQRAVALVQKFVESNANNSQSHVLLGSLELVSKNSIAAQAQFEQAIQIDPKNVAAYLQLGGTYKDKNQMDSALAQYQKALELQPKSTALIALVGNVYLQKNDLETARKYYARALEADSNFPMANANMAWVDAVEGKDLDTALAMAQKAKSQVPELPVITDVLAWVMYKRGNYSGAVPLLEDCVKKAPDSAQYHYHLGMALVAAGQKGRGRTQLQAAVQMNKLRPDEIEEARQALAR